MKVLKNPFVAFLIAVIVVFASSVISINIKLTNKSEHVTECFEQSYRSHGKSFAGIKPCIQEMTDIADDLIIIADNYGIKTSALSNSLSVLRADLKQLRSVGVSAIYNDYSGFDRELSIVETALESTALSERHTSELAEYSRRLDTLRGSIDSDAYNELVAKFYRQCGKFPAVNIASAMSIPFPQAFE